MKTNACVFAEALAAAAASSMMSRRASDQVQVESLKVKAYSAAADDIVKRFAR